MSNVRNANPDLRTSPLGVLLYSDNLKRHRHADSQRRPIGCSTSPTLSRFLSSREVALTPNIRRPSHRVTPTPYMMIFSKAILGAPVGFGVHRHRSPYWGYLIPTDVTLRWVLVTTGAIVHEPLSTYRDVPTHRSLASSQRMPTGTCLLQQRGGVEAAEEMRNARVSVTSKVLQGFLSTSGRMFGRNIWTISP
jgi:hypothetical protein